MKQERKLPKLLTGKNLDEVNSPQLPIPKQSEDVGKEIKLVGKDVKELLKETKKGTKALTNVEKILEKADVEKEQSKQKLVIGKAPEQVAPPIQNAVRAEAPVAEQQQPTTPEKEIGRAHV